MKQLSLTLSVFLSAIFCNSQQFQATIKPGSLSNSIIVAIKPDIAFVDAKITTFYFSIAVPATAVPIPALSILTNFNTALAYTPQPPYAFMVDGSLFNIYDFISDGATGAGTERNYAAGIDNNMVELIFTDGPPSVRVTIRIVSLTDGGATSNSYFNIYNLGTDVTNTTAMFYGGTPVNSPGGYSGTSYTSLVNVALPTKFLNFTATKKDDNAELTWTVDNEENNAYFDVQRSLDGRTFNDVLRVTALRNGRSLNTYSTPDINISSLGSKILYYRIKQVEAGGAILYSEVRQLKPDKKNFAIGLYPNPVVSITKLVIDAPEAGKAFIIIRDVLGKTVKQINMEFVKGINHKNLDASMLPAGEYNVTVLSGKFNQTIKMTKSN